MSMTFRLTLANDHAKTAIANLVAENVLAFIDHIDVMGNNGSLVLERIDFDHQLLAFEHDPDSYARIRCASTRRFNWCNFWHSCIWSNYYINIPVFRSVLVQNELMRAGWLALWFFVFGGEDFNGLMRVKFSVLFRLVLLRLIYSVKQNKWDPSRASQIGNRMMTGPRQDIRFAIPQISADIENLVGGQAFTFRLSGSGDFYDCYDSRFNSIYLCCSAS
jgi:hypothetical protein